jgi:sugar lactone lactonase YvrE
MHIRCRLDGVRGTLSAALFLSAIVAASVHGASAAGPGVVRASFGLRPSYTPKPKILSDVLYVSDSRRHVISVHDNNFGKHYPLYGEIALPSRPEGITTDANNQLYVTLRDTVRIYPPGTYVSDGYGKITVTLPKTPTSVLRDANDPTDVAVGPDGEIYVAEQGGPQSPSGGAVSVFTPGSNTAAYAVPFGAGTYVDGVTLDAANNLYISWRDASGTAYINVSPPPAAGGVRTTGSDITGITGDVFRGVLYDEKYAAIVYADYSAPQIWSYPQIKEDKPFDQLGTPDYIAFDEHETHLFVPDYEHNLVEIYDFPSGGVRFLLGTHGGAPAGCALLPAPPL